MDDDERYHDLDPSDDRDGWDGWADATLDAQLRGELDRLVPLGSEAHHVWTRLTPSMRAARRRRVAGQGVAAVAVLALLAITGMQLGERFGPGSDEMIMTGPASGPGGPGFAPPTGASGPVSSDGPAPEGTDVPPADADANASVSAGASSRPGTGAPVPTSGAVVEGGETSPETRVPVTDEATPIDSDPLDAAASTTSSRPAATTSHPAATPGSAGGGTSTIALPSELGSVVVSMSGASVDLVETRPEDGVHVEVHNDGPEEIEVTFRRAGTTVQFEAHVRNGELAKSITGGDTERHDDD